MAQPEKIQKSKLLLTEGVDAYYFFRHALTAFSVTEVQVMDYGGIGELT